MQQRGFRGPHEDTEAKNIVCTHGYKDIFSKYLNENGYNSFIENTPFQEEETIENNV